MSLFESKAKKELRKYLRENDFNFVSSGGHQDKDRLSKLWGRYSAEDEDYRKITVELQSKSATVTKQVVNQQRRKVNLSLTTWVWSPC